MQVNSRQNKMQELSNLIGNSIMIAIEYEYKGRKRVIYAKDETSNMTGSIKDRMAFHVLKKAYDLGKLKEGDHIIEATSGNTGISVAAIGRALGHPVSIFMPDWMSDERKNLIRSYGATIRLVSKEEGGFLGSIAMADALAAESQNTFLTHQFDNEDNVDAHYLTTGPELYWQLKYRNLNIDAFVAGVGTGGTVMGVGKFLKEIDANIKVHPLEPSNSPTMSTGHKVGKHRIQGISDEFIPSIVKLNKLDSIVAVDDGDSIIMAQNMAKTLGLGLGISSGANFLGAVMLQNELGDDAIVATVFADSNKKYLSTDLMKVEPVKNTFLTPDIKLLGFKTMKRLCHIYCDPSNCVESDFRNSNHQMSSHQCAHKNSCGAKL